MAAENDLNGWQAVAELHQRYLTGLLLYTVQKKGDEAGTELLFRTFRTQHLEKFVAGHKSLGLDHLPDAVACAQYIYLANHVGGVKCEFIPESDTKAWVRYLPPRWIWEGAAICAVPNDMSKAFMRAFHSQCGISLGNERLGFVCTKITTQCDPCLEGYFIEEDRPLGSHEKLRYRFDETGPDADAAKLPDVDWTPERMMKARRNYAVQYIRSILPELVGLLGDTEAGQLGRNAAFLIGMQSYDSTAATLGILDNSAASFATYLSLMLAAAGDVPEMFAEGDDMIVRIGGWRMMDGKTGVTPATFDAWNGLWQGALAVHNRHLALSLDQRMDEGAAAWQWRIGAAPKA
ncbi:MAG: hypothetical protein RLO08_19515 [Parvibaculaceae bacterium]